jgi:hypothetical protein
MIAVYAGFFAPADILSAGKIKSADLLFNVKHQVKKRLVEASFLPLDC